ncbi:MAG: hypothetical protein RBU21_23975 [FCB group bacterium]|nr:hypothetical protein [FCB group bacterium]
MDDNGVASSAPWPNRKKDHQEEHRNRKDNAQRNKGYKDAKTTGNRLHAFSIGCMTDIGKHRQDRD